MSKATKVYLFRRLCAVQSLCLMTGSHDLGFSTLVLPALILQVTSLHRVLLYTRFRDVLVYALVPNEQCFGMEQSPYFEK